MTLIAVPHLWSSLDASFLARNWVDSPNGTQKRMGNKATTLQALAHAVNRVLGRYPRTMFTKSIPTSWQDNVGSDPLLTWAFLDNVDNARSSTARIVALPRVSGSGDSYAARMAQVSSAEETPKADSAVASAVAMTDYFEDQYPIDRGNPADAEIEEGVSTFNGYTIASIVVQDDALVELDTALHEFCNPMLAKQGEKVLADLLEQIRDGLHKARTTNLPIWNYSSLWSGDAVATPVGSNHQGILVTSTSFVNVLDTSVTSRTATSPGTSHLVQYAGIGRSDQNQGKRIKLRWKVYAEVDGGASDGEVKLIGPDHVASNSNTISVTAGGGAAWYGGSSNYVYLNGQSTATDTSTARNKTDVHAKLATGATQKLYIYDIARWIEVS